MYKKIVVFSGIFGDYDSLKEPLFIDPKVQYLLFTDNPRLQSRIWQIVYLPLNDKFNDPQLKARYVKINSHLFLPYNHEFSVWVDSSFIVRVNNFTQLVEENLINNSFATFRHNKRNCVYDEIKVCNNLKLDYSNLFKLQEQKYRKDNFPCNYGLYSTGVLIRRNDSITKKINEEWWKEINKYSKRDQISLSYVFWKLQFKPNIILSKYGIDAYKSTYFIKNKHKKTRRIYV